MTRLTMPSAMPAILDAIDAATQALRADNDSAEERSKRERENELDRLLRSYIVDGRHKFMFGGVCNLLGTIADICEQQSKLEGDDYEKAARLIEDCASACDMKYEVSDGQAD